MVAASWLSGLSCQTPGVPVPMIPSGHAATGVRDEAPGRKAVPAALLHRRRMGRCDQPRDDPGHQPGQWRGSSAPIFRSGEPTSVIHAHTEILCPLLLLKKK